MKSLGITDKEKYGSSSPSLATSKSTKNAKSFPTLTLTGKQITALSLDKLALGDEGTLSFKFKVKHLEAGSRYSSTLDSGDKPTEMTIALTDGHAVEDESDGEGPEADQPAADASQPDDSDDTAEDAAPSGDDGAEEDDEAASDKAPSKDTVSPSEAGLDD